jgi:L-seryl-tRNA(Ser) seleniumtransferase
MLARTPDELHADAEKLLALIGAPEGLTIAVEATVSTVGGGAMPTAELRSWAITVAGKKPEALDKVLRSAPRPIITTIRDGRLWLDLRTIAEDELPAVGRAVAALALDRRQ